MFSSEKAQLDAQWSVQFSCSVMSNSSRPHEPQHARPPCPSPTPGVHPNPRPSSQWCHPAISSSVVPFSSCPQSPSIRVFSKPHHFNKSLTFIRWSTRANSCVLIDSLQYNLSPGFATSRRANSLWNISTAHLKRPQKGIKKRKVIFNYKCILTSIIFLRWETVNQ